MSRVFTFLSSIFLIFVFSVNAQESGKTDDTKYHKVIIISTSDIHANIAQFPRLATIVKKYRSEYRHVVLFDSGDFFTGNPYVDAHKIPGQPITELMKRLTYTAITIGNHDVDYGLEALGRHINGMSNTRFVATNMRSSPPELANCLYPYTIVHLKDPDINIGVLGLINLTSSDCTKTKNWVWKAVEETDYKKLCDQLKLCHNSANIVLSHLGYEHDVKMMHYTPNIDLILGGHTHVTLNNGLVVSNTLLSHTGYRLNHVGVTELLFSLEKKPRLLAKKTMALSLDSSVPEDAETKRIVDKYQSNKCFSQHLGVATEPLTHSTLGRFFCVALKESAQADVALYNRGGIRLKDLEAGPITLSTIYELEPFRDHIVTCSMTKGDIEALILNKYEEMEKSHFSSALEIYCTGFSYQISDKENSTSITSTLQDNKVYKVAMSDYMCDNFQFPQKGYGTTTGILVRDALIKYLKTHKLHNPPPKQIPMLKKKCISL